QRRPVAIRRDHVFWAASGHATDHHGPVTAVTLRCTQVAKQAPLKQAGSSEPTAVAESQRGK
ncbi:MAG TPA: hypothetical protein VGM10_22595, partial [Actinocrinis sp.]